MKYKVLFDTNVLISASVQTASSDLSVKVQHPFSQISCELLDFIEKNIRKRIGIVTKFIEDEAYYNLEKSVKDEITDSVKDRHIDFEILSVILNICGDRLRKFLGILRREPVDEVSINDIIKLIEVMYSSLNQEAIRIQHLTRFKTRSSARRYRKMAQAIYKDQEYKIYSQLLNLIDNPAEYSDMKILAEAKYLFDLYKQTENGNIEFYIASCDHHFSPIRRGEFTSSQVTDKIYQLFKIKCDYPDKVLSTLTQYIK